MSHSGFSLPKDDDVQGSVHHGSNSNYSQNFNSDEDKRYYSVVEGVGEKKKLEYNSQEKNEHPRSVSPQPTALKNLKALTQKVH